MAAENQKPTSTALLEEDPVDGRRRGDFESRYPAEVRQLYLREFKIHALIVFASCLTLAALGIVALFHHHEIACLGVLPKTAELFGRCKSFATFEWPGPQIFRVIVIFVAGTAGAAVFVMRAITRAVYLQIWHKDRVLWRISFPAIGGLIAIVVFILNDSNVVAPFRKEVFTNLYFCVAYGFFVGYFADAIMRLASRIAGDLMENVRRRIVKEQEREGTSSEPKKSER